MSSGDIDWFTYYLHPETLQQDFDLQSPTQRWAQVPQERREAGVKILHGLLGTSHFREYIISAYPMLSGSQSHKYTGPTPPSTPRSPLDDSMVDISSAGRIGQCSRFAMSADTGLPRESLATVLKENELPELSTKQKRLLMVASVLTELVGFDVENVESAVHSAIRFIYYMFLLESNRSMDDVQFQYRRWMIRAAYREEDKGLSMAVDMDAGLEINCSRLKAHMDSLDETNTEARLLRYRVAYDLARVYLAQMRVAEALAMFRECRRVDPDRCRPNRFRLAGRSCPSVDEYIAACSAIVGPQDNTEGMVDTPTGEFGTMSISSKGSALLSEGKHELAMQQCLVEALSSDGDGLSCLFCVHPMLLQYCARKPVDELRAIKQRLVQFAVDWIVKASSSGKVSEESARDLEDRAWVVATILTGCQTSRDGDQHHFISGAQQSTGRKTVTEDQLEAHPTLCLDTEKAPLAMVRLSYCYLSGLRLMEREEFARAQSWFAQGQLVLREFPETTQLPVMAQHAEKDKALRTALAVQVDTHVRLAGLLGQLDQGANIDDLSEDIDLVLEAQAPIRFEFLEHLVLACLRCDNKAVFTRLVGTIATSQKLYQQLPEIHISLLQIASLLIVVRDALSVSGIEVDRVVRNEAAADSIVIPAEQMDKLRKSAADIATLLLKIPLGKSGQRSTRAVVGSVRQPGSLVENEIERFCRMWGDPTYLVLLGALLTEMLRDTGEPAQGPALCELVARIVYDDQGASIAKDVVDKGSKHTDIARIVMRQAARASPQTEIVWLYMSPEATPMFVEYVGRRTEGFAPVPLSHCVGQPWFQLFIPKMIRSLVGMGLSGAAAAAHQLEPETSYDLAIPMLVQAFERGEIDQQVAGFFWDSNMIEYGQYLARLPGYVDVDFAVPGEELAASRMLIVSALFGWLAGRLSPKL
ncbi:hypothetical protein GGI25_002174 [Coemansia spiralis]|uniref:Uncharacterized protein n=2 Tax=Coemansia TaxID=4863 RepID=A0A9W8GAK1_9FUNG|nr:hypothetical protein BX070DRAFT_233405 [Coemansia spiralis]KAJ1996183.1 hypothetical protein EDC05_000073 [Coemansia umbellata]KAJ2626060.1 hypothetical protein GGI26_000144 [Coemansia sp. RSA 1358]KAJ2678586.1 hypothetical protein GGI25_002174 [Coemansia spiralis]